MRTGTKKRFESTRMNVESLESRLALSFGFGGVHLDRPAGDMGHFGGMDHKDRSGHSSSGSADSQQREFMSRGGLSDPFHADFQSKHSFDRPGVPPPLARFIAAAPEVNDQDQTENDFFRQMEPVTIHATNVVVISVSTPKYQLTVTEPLHTGDVAPSTSLPAAASPGPAFAAPIIEKAAAMPASAPISTPRTWGKNSIEDLP